MFYMAYLSGDAENEYGVFSSDDEAIGAFLSVERDEDETVLEIYECNDDECLTARRLIWH